MSLPARKSEMKGAAMVALIGLGVLTLISALVALAVPTYNKMRAKAQEARQERRMNSPGLPLTEGEKVEAEDLVKKLIQAVEKRDTVTIHEFMDYEAMAEDVFHGLANADQMKNVMVEAMSRRAGGAFFYEVFGLPGRLVRHRERDGVPAVTLRFTSARGGAFYFDILLRRNEGGGLKIYDMYNYSFGVRASKEVRQMAAVMMGEDDGMVAMILGQAMRKQDMIALAGIGMAGREGRPREVISAYHALSSEMKNQPFAFVFYVKALQKMQDANPEEYATALEKARGILGDDATIDLLLLDRHALRADFAAARLAVEASLQTIGDDSRLLCWLGITCVYTNDLRSARESLKRAEIIEPDFADLVDLRLMILAAEKDYAGVVAAIKAFEARTDAVTTSERLADPIYDDFKKSPEFAEWSATAAQKAP